MMRQLALTAAFALLLPMSAAHANFSVVQDSCTSHPPFLTIYFTLINFASPTPACGLHIVPQTFPAPEGCRIVAGTCPPDWLYAQRGDGGGDWSARIATGCFAVGQIKRGFSFTLDPEFCCYDFQYTGPSGAIIYTQKECFTCGITVGAQPVSWGRVKRIYQ